MSKETFDYLLDRYLNNQCTEDEKKLVEGWYSLVGSDKEIPKTSQEWEKIRQQLWLKIKTQVGSKTKSFWLNTHFAKVAAVAFIFFSLAMVVYFMDFRPTNELVYNQEKYSNTGSTNQPIILVDGSKIILFPNSELILDKHFNVKERNVKLIGDAQFDIAPNKTKPFYVETDNTITKVIGTVFTIKSSSRKAIEVEVKEGLVTVYEKTKENSKDNGVVLTPNQKVSYLKGEQVFVTGIVEQPVPIEQGAKQINFNYQATPLKQVILHFEQAYGIEIIADNEQILNCNLTGDLNGNTLYEQLNILKFSLGIDYQVKGTIILLTGKGC